MPTPQVAIIARGVRHDLSDDPQAVKIASQPLILSVSGHQSPRVRIDGQDKRLSPGPTGVLALDLTRSTGYHRVEVDAHPWWFATEDSKLGLDGVGDMLRHLSVLGTGWSGQVLFSDGSGYRDPHVLYGWLDAQASGTLDAIETVLLSPRTEEVAIRKLSRRGGGAVLTVPTLRYIRASPRQHLSEADDGLLSIGERTFNPNRVIARRRQRTIDTIPNRRADQILHFLGSLVSEVMSAPSLSAAARARCRTWRERIGKLAGRPIATQLVSKPQALGLPRQGAEHIDRSYGAVYQRAREILDRFGWAARTSPTRRCSYIQSADRIYQAYAAYRVADALNLAPTTPILGQNALAFSGDAFDLYYDTLCPPQILRSWRATSSQPDESRPDLILHEKSTNRVAVLDAKYRLGPNGGASEDSRKEVSSYQSLFGLSAVTILFPGPNAKPEVVQGHGMSIVELPVFGAHDDLATSIGKVLSRLQDPLF